MNETIKKLYDLITEVTKRENITPNNEVLIPIPKKLVDDKEPNTIEFIKISGRLHKDKDLPIRVKMEHKRTTYDNNVYETINFVFRFSTDIDLDRLKEKIQI